MGGAQVWAAGMKRGVGSVCTQGELMATTVTGSRRQLTLGSTATATSAHHVTFITFVGMVLYALVALGLRFIMARVLFLFGQTMIDGPVIPLTWLTSWLGSWLGRAVEFSVVLPVEIKEATYQAFRTQYAGLPMPPEVSAQVFAYALFALPICLILGFATRLAALGLLALTVLLSVYGAPEALWTTHVYWGAILLVLITVGPGVLSLDAAFRSLYRA